MLAVRPPSPQWQEDSPETSKKASEMEVLMGTGDGFDKPDKGQEENKRTSRPNYGISGKESELLRCLPHVPKIYIILVLVAISSYLYGRSSSHSCAREKATGLLKENISSGIDLQWEDDDTLVAADDDYHNADYVELRSSSYDKEHAMPVGYGSPSLLDDVDFSKRSSCGISKCFWPSVSDPNIGYLLTTEGIYDGLYYSFDLAQDVAENCGVRHLYANETVLLINVTQATMSDLARMVFNPSRHAVGQKSPWVFYPHDTVLSLQKVVRAPTPNLLYGTGGTKWEAMVSSMPEFRRQLNISLDQLRGRLEQEKEKIECVFRRHPTYWLDFQGLIDFNGNFYHMDLDENYYTPPHIRSRNEHKQAECLSDFQRMTEGLTKKEFDRNFLLQDGDI